MNVNRLDFVKAGLSALGFLALDGLPVFAAPAGFRQKGTPKLVFGILSDTHLQSGWDGVTPHAGFPLTYVGNAMKLFRDRDIDAFMHLGDAAHRGKNVEVQYHRDIFEKYFPNGKSPHGGRIVQKLVVVGNHELYGNVAAGGGAWAPRIWKDPVERAKHVLCGDLPRHWEQVWGEKYEEVWHKEVNGYHFFGRHWETDEMKLANFINSKAEECSLRGPKPFFILSHRRHHFQFCNALRAFPNAIAFFGHWHQSNADYKTIYFDSFGGFFPNIQVGACRMDGGNALDGNERVTKGSGIMESVVDNGKAWQQCKNPSRQAMIVNVYDDRVVFERHEVGHGGKLGPDWVLPLNWRAGNGARGAARHPFSRGELAKVLGAPEFPRGSKLGVVSALSHVVERANGSLVVYREKNVKVAPSIPVMRVTIPCSDGNADSRPYAYDVVVIGDDKSKKLFKNVYWAGCNLGIGHAPDKGLTLVDIPKKELPEGKTLTIAVRPVSSLGSKGKPLVVTYSPSSGMLRNKSVG